jgi:hypothetical protein
MKFFSAIPHSALSTQHSALLHWPLADLPELKCVSRSLCGIT